MEVLAQGQVYVHVARSLLFDGGALTLVDLAPSTIWLATGSGAALGYLPTGAFLDRWAEAEADSGSGTRRIRATLSLLDPDAQLAGQSVLALGNPRVTASGFTYEAGVVEGIVPARSGACVLFLEWDRPSRSAVPSGIIRP